MPSPSFSSSSASPLRSPRRSAPTRLLPRHFQRQLHLRYGALNKHRSLGHPGEGLAGPRIDASAPLVSHFSLSLSLLSPREVPRRRPTETPANPAPPRHPPPPPLHPKPTLPPSSSVPVAPCPVEAKGKVTTLHRAGFSKDLTVTSPLVREYPERASVCVGLGRRGVAAACGLGICGEDFLFVPHLSVVRMAYAAGEGGERIGCSPQGALGVAESGLAGAYQAYLSAGSVNRRCLAKPALSPVPSLYTSWPNRFPAN